MIAIINYGSGNIQALGNIYKRLAIPFVFAATPTDLVGAEKIILPGVGAFDQAMRELERSGMVGALSEAVTQRKVPILGICVGMQLLAKSSEEGVLPGLGWIDGTVRKFDARAAKQVVRLPHMGWNRVEPSEDCPLFDGIDEESEFYFLHSYYFSCDKAEETLATTEYGTRFACAVHRRNIFGVQFHPEKSHSAGVQLLKNFATRTPNAEGDHASL